MSEVLVRRQECGSALSGQSTGWLLPSTAAPLPGVFGQGRRVPTSEAEEAEEGIGQLRWMLNETLEQLESLMASRSELEIPDVFALHPLSSGRIMAKVLKVEPARFYFVDDESVISEDVAD